MLMVVILFVAVLGTVLDYLAKMMYQIPVVKPLAWFCGCY